MSRVVVNSSHCEQLRPVSTARVDGWPVSTTREHRPSTRLVQTLHLCWRVMETGHSSMRLV